MPSPNWTPSDDGLSNEALKLIEDGNTAAWQRQQDEAKRLAEQPAEGEG